MFKFREGECVALKSDNPVLGLAAGERGTVWGVYDTQPPSYEVTFCPPSGGEFDALMYEEELVIYAEGPAAGEAVTERPGSSLAAA